MSKDCVYALRKAVKGVEAENGGVLYLRKE